MARLQRFIFLGVDSGTYYVNEQTLAKDNAQIVIDLAKSNGLAVVELVREISLSGRAPRQNPALFTLAAVAALGDLPARQAAFDALPDIARTGTHLFIFARYIEQFRGWGRSLRRGVASWYTDKSVDDLAYQTVKYRQRESWSHRDLLRLSHPTTDEPARKALFDWICNRDTSNNPHEPALISAFREIQTATPQRAVEIIGSSPISWEMLPDNLLTSAYIWEALLAKGMPITALIRQLPRLTNLGLTATHSKLITERLTDSNVLRKGRVHPVNLLIAQRTYASGHGVRGSQTWTPSRQVVDALDEAFYLSFGTITPTGKRTLIALDVSGSMTSSISGLPITCREASAALAMATARVEDNYDIVGFTASADRGRRWYDPMSTELTELAISPRQRLDDIVNSISRLNFGATDCALPFLWAQRTGRVYDIVAVYTDSETYANDDIHPHQALRDYRQHTGVDVKSIVVGMTSTSFSIADPQDLSSLDVVGFDSATPNLISEFARL
jgi:60 kDa SS-A/Ro ribonucleoprotein